MSREHENKVPRLEDLPEDSLLARLVMAIKDGDRETGKHYLEMANLIPQSGWREPMGQYLGN